MFVRHKLQKGLLAGGQGLKAEEMEPMSDYLAKLELVLGLTASIIRATKIHKVLKAILRLESIPKEEEFNFKTRSQSLLDKWNKLLADARAAIATATASTANGTNGVAGKTNKERAPKQPGPNGVSEGSGGKIDKAPSNAGAEKAAEEVCLGPLGHTHSKTLVPMERYTNSRATVEGSKGSRGVNLIDAGYATQQPATAPRHLDCGHGPCSESTTMTHLRIHSHDVETLPIFCRVSRHGLSFRLFATDAGFALAVSRVFDG